MVTVKRVTTSNQATDTDTNSHRITMAEISSNLLCRIIKMSEDVYKIYWAD